MQRELKAYFEDILSSINKIEKYIHINIIWDVIENKLAPLKDTITILIDDHS